MKTTKSKQVWQAGQQVRVGFLTGLTVLAAIQTPGDSQPDAYVLARGDRHYKFVPHFGIERITADEAEQLIRCEVAYRNQQRNDAHARVAQIQASAAVNARLMELSAGVMA